MKAYSFCRPAGRTTGRRRQKKLSMVRGGVAKKLSMVRGAGRRGQNYFEWRGAGPNNMSESCYSHLPWGGTGAFFPDASLSYSPWEALLF